MSSAVLGIDIGKSKFDAALIVDGKVKTKGFSNDIKGFHACKTWLEKLKVNPHICLESTGIYGVAFSTYMFENNYSISVVNPVQIKRFAESELSRNKTDKSDAKVIARFCTAMKPPLWHPVASSITDLKQCVTYLETLNIMLFQEKNRLESVNELVKEIIMSHINNIKSHIEEIKNKINKIIENDDNLNKKKKLLNSIPGLGYETIIRILSYISNIEDFDSPKKLAAFIGLNPKQHQSGSSVNGKTKLSKTGDPKMRKALYMPTLVAIRHNETIKEFYQRMRANGKCKMSAVGASMRKLLHIIYGVLKSEKPFEANLAR